jgi:hypothetical protein
MITLMLTYMVGYKMREKLRGGKSFEKELYRIIVGVGYCQGLRTSMLLSVTFIES